MDKEEKFLKRCSVVLTAGILAVLCCGLIPSAVLAQGSTVTFAAFGDYGGDNANEQAVADMVDIWGVDLIVTTGDNSYGSTPIDDNIGKYYSDYIGNYNGSYGSGSVTNRFWPAMGNHDFTDGGGSTAYFNYFTLPSNERYYDFVEGPVHFFVIDSNPAGLGSPASVGDGRSDTSAQGAWLQAQLAASTSPWKIVYMHHPPFSSCTTHGSEVEMQWPYENWGATAVLAGHDHVYERIIHDDNSDGEDFAYFTTGAGGRSLYSFGTPVAGSQVRYSSDYGSMHVTASQTSITFDYWSVAGGGTLIDTYTITGSAPGLICEDFESFTAGAILGTDPDWYDGGSGPTIGASNGVAGSQGLSSASPIFIWTNQPFDWNDPDFTGVVMQMDFETDTSGNFDDDRVGWMITDDATGSNNFFGIQLDPGGGGPTGQNIEAYWDGDTFGDDGGRTSIADLPVLSGSTFYRLTAEITKLTATSARIDATLTELDGSGDEVQVVAVGSIPDTDALPNGAGEEIPNAGYFTATTLWPAFKNYTGTGAADNACYAVLTDTGEPPLVDWTAYNDLGALNNTSPSGNFTFITTDLGGNTGLPHSGELVDLDSGGPTGVTLSVAGGDFNGDSHVTQFTGSPSGDAANIFSGIDGLDVGANFDATGTISYGGTGGPDIVLSFSGMDPAQVYTLVTFGHRDDYTDRVSGHTLSDVDAFTNESSAGTIHNNTSGLDDPLFDGASDDSTILPSDNDSGWMVKYTNIEPGSDGDMTLTIADAGVDYNGSTDRGRYINAVMLQAGEVVSQPVVAITGTPLNPFSSEPGVVSPEQSYTVSGSNLTDDITVTAPADFEISTTSGSGFGPSLVLSHTGGSVPATPIYVHFLRATEGISSGDISHTSSGATTQLVAVSGEAAPPSATVWTAYNDLAWGSGQLEGNISKITSPVGGSGNPSSGDLVQHSDGSDTDVDLTITGGTFNGATQAGHGGEPAAGTDAYAYFNGIVSCTGAVSYVNDAGNNFVLTYENLDPAMLYNLVFYANRGDYGWDRASLVTISGADTFVNDSSTGLDNHGVALFSGPGDDSTRLPANNGTTGYVARFTGVNPGSDGQVVLTVSFDGESGFEYLGKYASAMLLEEYSATVHTLTVNTVGNGNVTLNPPGGSYAVGTPVQLTATPDPTWQFDSWSGNLSGSINPETLIMTGDMNVTATFTEQGPLAAGDLIISSIQSWNTPTGQNPGEFVEIFNTTGQTIPLDGMEIISRTDNNSDGVVDIDWQLAEDLTGLEIAPYSFFLVAEAGVNGENGVRDVETDMDLATGEGGVAERAISVQLMVDGVHMDYVVYGRHDGNDPAGELPPGDRAFDGSSYPRTEVIRNTLGTSSYEEGVLRRLDADDLYAGYDVEGFYTDEGSLAGTFPDGVWYSPHDNSFGSYVVRNSTSAPVPPGGNEAPEAPVLVAPLDDAIDVNANPELRVTVSDPDLDTMDVTFFGREVEVGTGGDPFTLIPLPDTQKYSQSYPANYMAQTQWVVDNILARNIVYLAHEGDMVENAGVESEWLVADAAMSLLEDSGTTGMAEGLPYGVLPGNHDQPTGLYNTYFGTARFSSRSYYGGNYLSDNDNNYTLFSAGGMDFIVVNLEYNPSAGAITWADNLFQTFSDRRGIVVSHYLMNTNGSWSAAGSSIYEAVKDNPNVFLMLCGHMHGEAVRTDTYNGNTIHSILADYQDLPSGGNGWLRAMEFRPEDNQIYVETYTPVLDQLGTDAVMGDDTTSEPFVLNFDMGGSRADFTNLGTAYGVASGGDAIVNWSGLTAGTQYEWYVEVSDGSEVVTSPVWSFTTQGTAPQYTLTVNTVGSGSVTSIPDQALYDLNDIVQLTAVPDMGWEFSGWSGDLSGTTNPDNITITGNMTVTATFEEEGAANWIAYNDMNNMGSTNAPYVTEHDYTTVDGILRNYAGSGENLTATITGTTNNGYDPYVNGGNITNATSDAYLAFDGIVDLTGVMELDEATWEHIITFDNLDPTRTYSITLTANRDNLAYENERYTRVTIEGADTSVNASSVGVVVNSPESVSFSTGYNTINGFVAKWTGITTGPDGSFSIKSEWDDTFGGTKGYAMSAFRLEEFGATTSSAFASDDFDRHNLDTSRWTFTNPLGDGWVAMTGAGTGDAKLELSVPEGPSHDPYHSNPAVSVMQPCADMDFDVEVKFDTEPAIRYQLQGFIVEQDADNWLRLDVHHDGTNLLLFAGRTTGGTTTNVINDPIASGSAGYLRLLRAGDEWTFYYSSDGATWNEAANFTHAMNVSAIGPFVANHTGTGGLSPAYTAVVDYFFDRSAPIVPEDGGAPADVIEPFIHTASRSAGGDELIVSWYTDEPCLGSVEYGPDTGYGSSVSDGGGIYYHTVAIPGLIPDQTIHYRIISDDGTGNIAFSGDYEITFSPDGPTIAVWYGLDQSFGVLGQPQPWANILGHVSDADGVASLSYTLNGGPPVTLTIGPDARRLENSGDFNVDLATGDLVPEPGTNTVVITALDNLSNASTATVTVSYTAGTMWPGTYATDWGSLTADGDPLTPDPVIQDQSQVVDGKWSLDGSSVRTVEPGYDRLIAIGDVLWDDYEATVSLTLHDTPGGYGAGLLFRWNGHTDDPVLCPQPHCGYEPLGEIGWFRSSGLDLYKGGSIPFTLSTETLYWMKMRVENNGSGVLYSIKAWEDGASEPVDWMLTNQQGPTTPQAGSLMLISHQADVSFGDVSIEPVIGLPNVAPVANNDVAFVLRGDSADINILSNDTDSDGTLNPASVTITDPPDNGTIDAIDPVTGIVTYIHDGGSSNSDSFIYTVNDNDGEPSNPATVDITVTDEPLLAFESDDFNSCSLDPRWTFVNSADGLGDAIIVGGYTDDAQVAISLPAGAEHQMWNGNIGVPYIIQTATNTDFTLEVKFDSPVSDPNYQEQGIIIRQDDTHWLRLEFYNNNGPTMILASYPYNNLPTNNSIGVTDTAPLYMRVNRSGDVWTQSYSLDGTTWMDAPGTGFTYAMNVTGVGCYVGNAGDDPAHTALVDYFLNVDEDPIVGEDSARNTLAINIVGQGSVTKDPDETSYSCNESVTLTASPAGGWQFDGWTGDLESLLLVDTIFMDEPKVVTATFSPMAVENTVAMDTGGVAPLSTTNLCAVGIPCEITRNENTDIRLFSVTIALNNLELCDGLNSISEGDYLSSIGATEFLRVDNGDGSYTVDGTLLSDPCGATAAMGTLFTIDVDNAIPEGDGTGTITITQVVLRDCLNGDIGVTAGAPADISIDTTPPAPAENLLAQQVLAGNPSGSTTGINLTWTPLADPEAVSVELYRKGFGFWPEYDDDGGSEPTAPQADPEDDGWVFLTSLLPADDAHPDTPGGRDHWHYCAIVLDGAGNRSAPVMTDGELNYMLADVSDGGDPPGDGNNKVWTEDITMLGYGYGTSAGEEFYSNVLDVGPTDDRSIFGLPDTDDHVNFEDLMIFSISFGRDFGPITKQPVEVVQSPLPGDRNSLSVVVPALPGPGQTFQVSLTMIGDGQVQGLSIPLFWNSDVIEPLEVQAGALLAAQGGTGLALSPQPGTVDVGLMGMRELGIAGEGVLAEITCKVLAVGDPGIDLGEVKARSRNNEDIDLIVEVVTELPETPDLPGVTALHTNAPNPFNPQTTISFDLAQAGRVRVRIYGLDGRLVKTLVDDVLTPGRYSEIWDGSDRAGRNVASGIYLFRMEAPDMSQTRRMMLLK